ncbi:MAG: hypothetical protein FWE01_02045 [Firmicutes bacterium]|nr:hypothetical protein [Bacillota bacterium]
MRKLKLLGMFAVCLTMIGFGAFFLTGCGGNGETPAPTVTAVNVTPQTRSFTTLGASYTFQANVVGNNSPSQDVTWLSSHPSIVTVNNVGLAQLVATATTNQEVTITATSVANTSISGVAKISVNVNIPLIFNSGTGTPDRNWYEPAQNEFEIWTADELAGFAQLVNRTYGTGNGRSFNNKTVRLMANIDLSEHYGETFNDGKGWIPIGFNLNSGSWTFHGTFDGNGKTIKGLYINQSEVASFGLFGIVAAGATIKNLTLIDVDITSTEDFAMAGGLVGHFRNQRDGASVAVIGLIENVHVTGNIIGHGRVGGIVGVADGMTGLPRYVTVRRSSFVGKVEATTGGFVGGIAGALTGNIDQCFVNAEILGPGGGIVGQFTVTADTNGVTNNIAKGSVISTDGRGVAAGIANSAAGIVRNNIAMNTINSMPSAEIPNQSITAGGIVGTSRQLIGEWTNTRNNVALNPKVIGNTNLSVGANIRVNRVVGDFVQGVGIFSNNYALDTMENQDGNTEWARTGHNQMGGENVANSQLILATFWTTETNWYGNGWDTDIWHIANGALPILQWLRN